MDESLRIKLDEAKNVLRDHQEKLNLLRRSL